MRSTVVPVLAGVALAAMLWGCAPEPPRRATGPKNPTLPPTLAQMPDTDSAPPLAMIRRQPGMAVIEQPTLAVKPGVVVLQPSRPTVKRKPTRRPQPKPRPTPARPGEQPPTPPAAAKKPPEVQPLRPAFVNDATLVARTSSGNVALFDVRWLNNSLALWHLETTQPTGTRVISRFAQVVKDGYAYDLDTGRLTKSDRTTDIRWEHGRGLYPENGAVVKMGYDFARITPVQIDQWTQTYRSRFGASSPTMSLRDGYAIDAGSTAVNQLRVKLSYRTESRGVRITRIVCWNRQRQLLFRKYNLYLGNDDCLDFDTGQVVKASESQQRKAKCEMSWSSFYGHVHYHNFHCFRIWQTPLRRTSP